MAKRDQVWVLLIQHDATQHKHPNGTLRTRTSSLLVVLSVLSELDVVELESVGVLIGGDNTEPLAHLVLLEELLGQVLEVALGEGDRGRDLELAGADARDLDVVSELADLALDLDLVNEELLVRGGVEDLVVGGAGEVDDENRGRGGLLGGLLRSGELGGGAEVSNRSLPRRPKALGKATRDIDEQR